MRELMRGGVLVVVSSQSGCRNMRDAVARMVGGDMAIGTSVAGLSSFPAKCCHE